MKTWMAALGVALAFMIPLVITADGARAESKLAKKYDAGPAIQGNSDPATAMHKKKAAKAGMHKKAM